MLEIFHKKDELQPKIEGHVDRAGIVTCEGMNYNDSIKKTENAVREIKFIISRT